MKRRIGLATALGLLLCIGSRSQQKTSLDFKHAEARGNSVLFEPAFPVDWQKNARANFHLFDIDHPDRTQIREHFFEVGGNASFEYEAPLTIPNSPSFYYLVADSGTVRLIPQKLVGVISYQSDDKAAQVEPATFTGRMSARPLNSAKVADAGFVLISDRPLAFKLSPVPVVQDENSPGIALRKVNEQKVVYSYRDSRGSRVDIGEHIPGFPGVKEAYVISISDQVDKYLFVSWKPDIACIEGCCEHSYWLVPLGKEPGILIANAAGCDV